MILLVFWYVLIGSFIAMLFSILISISFMCSCNIYVCLKNVSEPHFDIVSFVRLREFIYVCMCLILILCMCNCVIYICHKNVSECIFDVVSLFSCLCGFILLCCCLVLFICACTDWFDDICILLQYLISLITAIILLAFLLLHEVSSL